MKGLLARTLAILAGIVLGGLVVSGFDPWRELLKKPDTTPPPPIQRERAPDTRV